MAALRRDSPAGAVPIPDAQRSLADFSNAAQITGFVNAQVVA